MWFKSMLIFHQNAKTKYHNIPHHDKRRKNEKNNVIKEFKVLAKDL
jgi:hypothetical protein